ncbi:MAG: acetylglutamate kinase, partial [Coriobacteriia bacterium]|nr:acetylglutamate kinase [Coriobacteriia bacterium]
FLTDVDGLYLDFEDKSSLINRLSLSEARALLNDESLSKGMIPKIQACTQALSAGVSRAHILNGTLSHSMLLELFTDEGVGTMVLPDKEDEVPEDFSEFPTGNLASKLHG